MVKNEELISKTESQLLALIDDNKKELMNLRFQLTSGTITNTSRIKLVRKMIAKIKTLLNNKRPKKAKEVGVKRDA